MSIGWGGELKGGRWCGRRIERGSCRVWQGARKQERHRTWALVDMLCSGASYRK